jgi:hypothetical protein
LVISYLKPESEPDTKSYAAGKADDAGKNFDQTDYDKGAETHRVRQVEVLPQLGLTM